MLRIEGAIIERLRLTPAQSAVGMLFAVASSLTLVLGKAVPSLAPIAAVLAIVTGGLVARFVWRRLTSRARIRRTRSRASSA